MTIDDLLTKLQRVYALLEHDEDAEEVVFTLYPDGSGMITVTHARLWGRPRHEFTFNDLTQLQVVLGGVIAGLENEG